MWCWYAFDHMLQAAKEVRLLIEYVLNLATLCKDTFFGNCDPSIPYQHYNILLACVWVWKNCKDQGLYKGSKVQRVDIVIKCNPLATRSA